MNKIIEVITTGHRKKSSVWEHKLRCKYFLQNLTFEQFAAEPQTVGSKGQPPAGGPGDGARRSS